MIEIVCIKPKTNKISYIKIERDNLEYIENTGNGGGFFIKRKKRKTCIFILSLCLFRIFYRKWKSIFRRQYKK